MRATAKQVEVLNHALNGFRFLHENHEAIVQSATVEIEGEDFKVTRDFDFDVYDEDGNQVFDGVLVVEFE